MRYLQDHFSKFFIILILELYLFFFKDTIIINKKVYDIVEVPKPVGVPYLILEMLSRDKNASKGLFIMNFEAKSTLTLVKKTTFILIIRVEDRMLMHVLQIFQYPGVILVLSLKITNLLLRIKILSSVH